MDSVKKGDTIIVEYTGRLEDGTIFESSKDHEEPLQFTVGESSLIKGFDQAVIGMKIGEEKEITIPPEDAYGYHKPELVRDVSKKIFSDFKDLKPDMMFMMSLKDGQQVPVRIIKVSDENVTVDINSPLVGKTLIFTIKIVSIAS